MDQVRIKALINGKVKYYAAKDKDGNFIFQDKKSDSKIVDSIECQDLFPDMREYFQKVGYNVILIKEKVK